MAKECCIIGAAPSEPYIKKGAFVIAADGGLAKLEALGVTPDLALGDFDSLGKRPTEGEVITFPVDKDDTDTMLAVKEALRRGYDRLYISGGLGGKLDHTLANLQSLLFADRHGADAYLVGNGQTVMVLHKGRCCFRAKAEGRFSVFSAGERAEGVTITGLRYPAEGITLTNDIPLGVSNHFVGKEASISIDHGTLVLIWDGAPEDICQKETE